jgi:hypothetical protein
VKEKVWLQKKHLRSNVGGDRAAVMIPSVWYRIFPHDWISYSRAWTEGGWDVLGKVGACRGVGASLPIVTDYIGGCSLLLVRVGE